MIPVPSGDAAAAAVFQGVPAFGVKEAACTEDTKLLAVLIAADTDEREGVCPEEEDEAGVAEEEDAVAGVDAKEGVKLAAEVEKENGFADILNLNVDFFSVGAAVAAVTGVVGARFEAGVVVAAVAAVDGVADDATDDDDNTDEETDDEVDTLIFELFVS